MCRRILIWLLRLLLNGYTLRWATYSLGGFKEGVSLTVDELARWQKYAYAGLIDFLFFVAVGCGVADGILHFE
jgi:Glycosyl transferase family group 2